MPTAFVYWPSAPLTDTLIRYALSLLEPSPKIVQNLIECSDELCLQWSTYDEQDHHKTLTHPSSVMASSYTIRKALIRKNFLHRCIHTYVTKNPESILVRHIPRTWDLELSYADELDELWTDELWDLGQEMEMCPQKWWILKPAMADRGMGIRMFNNKDTLQAIFENFEDNDEQVENESQLGDTRIVTSQLRHFVVQEYLARPLLLNPIESEHKNTAVPPCGHKFHLRAYIVACGAIKVYLFRHVLALFSSRPYEQPESSSIGYPDLAPHLTNTCLQDGHDERFVRLFNELAGHRIYGLLGETTGTLTAMDTEDIMEQMTHIVAEVFKAAIQNPVHFQILPNAFELYGVDFLVTHNLSEGHDRRFVVSLLELNSEPAIEMTGARLRWVLQELFVAISRNFVAPFFRCTKGARSDEEDGGEQLLKLCLELDIR